MLRKKKQTPQEQSDQEFNLALEVLSLIHI